jgi:uncharacterized repeat protein (TIGR04076 family)
MANIYGTPEVHVTVREVLGSGDPPCGYGPGDSWLVSDYQAPPGLCMWALAAMTPFLASLRFGGCMPWEDNKDRAVACCPDAANPVVFELTRLPTA